MDQLGASLAQVMQNNQQLTEGAAQQQVQLRIQAAISHQEAQAHTYIHGC